MCVFCFCFFKRRHTAAGLAGSDALDRVDLVKLVAERDFLRRQLATNEDQLHKKRQVVDSLQDELSTVDGELGLKDDIIQHLRSLLANEKQARAKEMHTTLSAEQLQQRLVRRDTTSPFQICAYIVICDVFCIPAPSSARCEARLESRTQ